jgi:hypothetical protein
MNRIKYFYFWKIYWLIYLKFLPPRFVSRTEKVDPYFRQNESSEASGVAVPRGPRPAWMMTLYDARTRACHRGVQLAGCNYVRAYIITMQSRILKGYRYLFLYSLLFSMYNVYTIPLRIVPVFLNLIQKLPFPTKLPVMCPRDFIRSICLGETLRWEKLDGKSPGSGFIWLLWFPVTYQPRWPAIMVF